MLQLLILLLVLMIGGDAFQSEPPESADCLDPEWRDLLECYEVRTDACYATLVRLGSERESSALHALAGVLLEEWQIPENEEISEPRLVWTPSISEEALRSMLPARVRYSIIALRGKVTAEGTVESIRYIKRSEYEAANEVAKQAFGLSCYRPAYRDGEFRERESSFSLTVHPR